MGEIGWSNSINSMEVASSENRFSAAGTDASSYIDKIYALSGEQNGSIISFNFGFYEDIQNPDTFYYRCTGTRSGQIITGTLTAHDPASDCTFVSGDFTVEIGTN